MKVSWSAGMPKDSGEVAGGEEIVQRSRGNGGTLAQVSSSGKADSNVEVPSAQKMSRSEVILLCCSVVSLIISCILWSSRKQAWMDEIMTWKEASDPSLWHLYSAIQHGADGGQALFYTTAWLWVKLFGAGVLTLRLYSCVAMCAALVVAWTTLRRFYGLWATAFGVLTIWGTSGLLLDQNAEARFYGLYMLTVAITVDLYSRLATRPVPTTLLLVCTLLSQAALVLTHVLGLFYSGLVLLALIVYDAAKGRVRLKVYLFYAAGWLALLVWVPAIRSSMAAGRPHGWIPLPHLGTVLNSYFFEDYAEWVALLQRHSNNLISQIARDAADLVILIAIAVVLVGIVRRFFNPERRSDSNFDNPLVLVSFALLTTPIVLYLLSHLVTPVFLPRYVLPGGIGMAIILTAFADSIGSDRRPSLRRTRLAWASIAVLLVISPVGSALVLRPPQINGTYLDVQRLDDLVPKGVPLVAGWQNDFETLMRFSRHREDRFYLLDWPTALSGASPRELVLDYHLMWAYREAGYYGQSIQDRDAFFCSHRDFFVLDSRFLSHAQDLSWFDLTVGKMPQFEWKVVDSTFAPEALRKLIFVHRRAPLDFCSVS
jgi:hypothetical protein